MTERLYQRDSLLLEFEARVVSHGEIGGRPSVLVDRTAFYPESGGQMADRGLLAGLAVADVQEDESGAIHHVLDGERPAVGAEVRGRIDRARRRAHMALHTGQHVLSRALLDLAGAETLSARLGETACTIDTDVAVDYAAVARAEDLSNAVVDDDLEVRAFFPTEAELASLPLRRPPKVEDRVRIVRIGDFDFTPCGGTHCLRTAQIGLVRVDGVERYKGGTRVTFASGPRARASLARESSLLHALGRDLTCAPTEIATAVERLRKDLGATREALGQARARVADAVAEGLLARGEPHMIAAIDGAPVELLRAVATRLLAVPDGVALLAGPAPDGTPIVVARGAQTSFDCGGFVKRAAAASGGRGGGRPERAEGRLPPGVEWPALVRSLLAGS